MTNREEFLDREQVGDVLVHYCFLLDTHEPARVADDVFTADAAVDYGVGPWRGCEEIAAAFVEMMAHFDGTAHVVTNVHVEVNGDRARSRAYVSAWHWLAGGGPSPRPADFLVIGAYLDDFRHVPEGWRIERRRFRPVGSSVLAVGELPDILVPQT